MKRNLTLLVFFYFLFLPAFSQNSIDEKINQAVSPATQLISDIVFYSIGIYGIQVPVILIWLLTAAIFFTAYLGFPNIRYFRHAVKVTSGAFDKTTAKGEVTHFQALSAALSGTLGLGNIAGVAIAISIGGPGATFWMILAGLLGMSSKFAECTLGVKYRNISPGGKVSGGPMYYLSKGLKGTPFAFLGKGLAVLFALMCIGGSLGGGNMFQSNQTGKQILSVVDIPFLSENAWIIGLILSILVALVIIGGIKKIGKVAEVLVPFMCGIYILACFIVLTYNYKTIPSAFLTIFKEAFNPTSVAGGFAGVMIQGFRRAFFSNEAGIGSASIAHSAVKTDEPISEGMVALLEPFIDTVIVCTMTALVIVITGTYQNAGLDGIELTSRALGSVSSWFPFILTLVVFLFAYSTMLSWSYYGLKSWTYLFGESKFADTLYKILFCVFIIIGSSMDLTSVVNFSDAMIFAMSFPNIIGLYFLAPEIKKELSLYLNKLKSGQIREK